MSDMIIQIVAVEVGSAKSKAGKDYEFVEVTYKNKSFQDKVEAKKHNQYGDKNVFNTLKSANSGDVFTIERKKDDAGYWQWIGITSGTASGSSSSVGASSSAPSKSTSNPAPKSTYETPEERAKKQVYIIRQSSISSAIELLKTDKKVPDVTDILHVAKVFEDYVFGVNLDADANVQKVPEYDEDNDVPM